MENDKKIIEAINKLHDCDALSNKTFKFEYMKYFKLTKRDYVPAIGEFISNPPNKNDDEEGYNFWFYFCKKYPNSDNTNFRQIYEKINKTRVTSGAHYTIGNLDKKEFDKCMQIAFLDIYNDKNIYDDYKNWIFLFPA